jgi:hypothetical protein
MDAWDESQSRHPHVPASFGNEAAMAAIMADDEQKGDKEPIGHREKEIDGKREIRNRAQKRTKVQQRVDGKEAEAAPQRTRIDNDGMYCTVCAHCLRSRHIR